MPPSSRSQPTRFVVIPSFDQPDDTTRCVDALQGKSLGEYTVVVVDHGQQGWTVPDDLSSEAVQVIRADPDLWWTGATNVGIQHAIDQGATSVMLMNADCVLDSASATRLFQRCETEGTIVAPIQVDLANGATACAGAIPLTLLGFPTIRERKATGRFWDRFTIVCGGRGVAIPTAVFEKVGMLAAESLPHYWADHDFFMRCRRAGFAMEIQADLQVAVDDTRTTSAARTEDQDWASFQRSLSHRRSHRNRTAIRSFFRRNYPIRSLHFIGSSLYLLRYTTIWTLRRATQLLRRSHVL